MRTFVVKLAAWHRVFKELEDARLRLAQAEVAQAHDAQEEKIRENVCRLQRACDLALGELRASGDAFIAAGSSNDKSKRQAGSGNDRLIGPRSGSGDSPTHSITTQVQPVACFALQIRDALMAAEKQPHFVRVFPFVRRDEATDHRGLGGRTQGWL